MNSVRRVIFAILALMVISGESVRSEVVTFGTGDNQFEMEFVTIGNPGNAPDTGGSLDFPGAVSYTYHMSKYEVSQDMVDKVNAATTMDQASLGLRTLNNSAEQPTLDFYGIRDPQQPAISVSWVVAARFVNWLNVSLGYPPAYRFEIHPGDDGYEEYWKEDASMWSPDDRGYDRTQPYRNRLARFVIPSRDEWYKAAYHDAAAGTEGAYFDYPTGSDDPPIPVTGGIEPGTAVYLQPESQGPAIVTQAGGPSPYGTIGQGGNAYEYGEWFPRSVSVQPAVWLHGGSWSKGDLTLFKTRRRGINPTGADADFGFRVAMLNPLGDFDEDGVIAAADIDLLAAALKDGSSESVLDLDQNDIVDLADHRFWVEEIVGTHSGDADLNGTVEFADFLALSASFGQETGWAGGDFDGNGVAEFADFLLLSDNFGKTRTETTSVPEPSTGLLLVGVLIGVSFVRRIRTTE